VSETAPIPIVATRVLEENAADCLGAAKLDYLQLALRIRAIMGRLLRFLSYGLLISLSVPSRKRFGRRSFDRHSCPRFRGRRTNLVTAR
jgi:hypothetical protein